MTLQSFPVRALFGSRPPKGENWDEVHAIQLEGLANSSDMRMGVIALLSMIAAAALSGIIPPMAAMSWAVLNCSCALAACVFRRNQQLPEGVQGDGAEVRKATRLSTIFGFSWAFSVPMVVLAGGQSQEILYGLIVVEATTLVAMLMFATSLSALPGISAVFNLMVTLPMAGALLWLGQPYLAGAFSIIASSLTYFAIRSGVAQTSMRLSEKRLRDKSETVSLLLREFEDTGADWLWQTDTGRRLIHVSPRFAHALGREAEEIENLPLLQLVAGDRWEDGNFPKELHELAERLKRREAFSNLVVPVLRDGMRRWWELSASPRLSEDSRFLGFRGVGSDVTEQWESQKKISHLARFDTLTALPNRLQITEGLGEALAECEKWRTQCAFLMIDLDRFKQVNDTLGHLIGDRLLAKVSRRLAHLISEKQLCGRLGGDEFAILIRDAEGEQQIEGFAQTIIERLSEPYEVDQHTIYIGASVGSALGPRDGRTVEMLMRSADLALYESKECGRGVHSGYKPQLHAAAEEKRLMEIELRQALPKREFNLVYQPVVDAGDGSPVSFEALLRWTNGTYGDVSPAKFIPLAEDANLIVPIGAWVLEHACADAVAWPDHIRVAVNVSADQLMNPDFVTTVVQALRRSRLPAHRLEIEVTESLFMRDGGTATQVLDQLRALGIKLSLDDFGTGYSSLGYLRKTRFDSIKIDKSFVQGAARRVPENIAIIRAVVAMADSLSITTTAEGVETDEELAMIRQLGCKRIQGYLFGRPMRLSETMLMFEREMPVRTATGSSKILFND